MNFIQVDDNFVIQFFLVFLHFDCFLSHEIRHGIFYLCCQVFIQRILSYGAFPIWDLKMKDIQPIQKCFEHIVGTM